MASLQPLAWVSFRQARSCFPQLAGWNVLIRHSSSNIEVHRPWSSLSTSHQQAWQALGVKDENAWKVLSQKSCGNGTGTLKLKEFQKLPTAQQAAILHGLGADVATWDAFVKTYESQQLEISEPHKPELVKEDKVLKPAGMADSLISSAWHFTKKYGPALGSVLKDAGNPGRARGSLLAMSVGQLLEMLPWMVDMREGPVLVDALETVLYLDDSGSMNGANLSEARGALRKMAHLLQDSPTRVCTFGTHKQVILPREHGDRHDQNSGSTALVDSENAPQYFSEKFDRLNPDIIGLQWKGKSPGTYMWHMILEDIREKYIPGTGKLRAIVITDGLDTHSPSPYRGISGMNPMMQQLLEEGFDIEWHIVVVSIANVWASISTADISKYEALAETTGNVELWNRFIQTSHVLYRDSNGQVALRDACYFVFGGDAVDHHAGDLQILDDLLSLKRRYKERVHFIIGNRDVNKLRLPFELSERFRKDWPLKEHPGVYWLTDKRPRDCLTEEVLNENSAVDHLKWILKETLGAGKAFECRREELQRFGGIEVDDDVVLKSFVQEASPGGRIFEYLTLAKLAVQLGDVLFVHAGLPRSGVNWTPGWLPPKGEILPVSEWIIALDDFKTRELAKVVEMEVSKVSVPKASFSMEGGYDHPQPGAALMQYMMRDMQDGSMQPSILYNGFLGDDYQPLNLDLATQEWLTAGGVRRVCAGHLPHGDAPLVLRYEEVVVITADISYADFVSWPTKVIPNQVVCEVLLEKEETLVHGHLGTGQPYEARLSDEEVGKVLDGWRVKGRLKNGQVVLSQNDGWNFSGRFGDGDVRVEKKQMGCMVLPAWLPQ
eukprot:symbB.v1.2.000181.t1/scaffold9.1/size550961/37